VQVPPGKSRRPRKGHWSTGTSRDWVNESYQIARSEVYGHISGQGGTDADVVLPPDYGGLAMARAMPRPPNAIARALPQRRIQGPHHKASWSVALSFAASRVVIQNVHALLSTGVYSTVFCLSVLERASEALRLRTALGGAEKYFQHAELLNFCRSPGDDAVCSHRRHTLWAAAPERP
jgi:hypothetical protein